MNQSGVAGGAAGAGFAILFLVIAACGAAAICATGLLGVSMLCFQRSRVAGRWMLAYVTFPLFCGLAAGYLFLLSGALAGSSIDRHHSATALVAVMGLIGGIIVAYFCRRAASRPV